jgi:hypothetical protein
VATYAKHWRATADQVAIGMAAITAETTRTRMPRNARYDTPRMVPGRADTGSTAPTPQWW